jgi:hypothetical protein
MADMGAKLSIVDPFANVRFRGSSPRAAWQKSTQAGDRRIDRFRARFSS